MTRNKGKTPLPSHRQSANSFLLPPCLKSKKIATSPVRNSIVATFEVGGVPEIFDAPVNYGGFFREGGQKHGLSFVPFWEGREGEDDYGL